MMTQKDAEYFAAVHAKLVKVLTKGTETNWGIFSHWNENNYAIFETGWIPYRSLHFIQLPREPRPLVVKNPFVMKPLIKIG
jgi:hypothetical protein